MITERDCTDYWCLHPLGYVHPKHRYFLKKLTHPLKRASLSWCTRSLIICGLAALRHIERQAQSTRLFDNHTKSPRLHPQHELPPWLSASPSPTHCSPANATQLGEHNICYWRNWSTRVLSRDKSAGGDPRKGWPARNDCCSRAWLLERHKFELLRCVVRT